MFPQELNVLQEQSKNKRRISPMAPEKASMLLVQEVSKQVAARFDDNESYTGEDIKEITKEICWRLGGGYKKDY